MSIIQGSCESLHDNKEKILLCDVSVAELVEIDETVLEASIIGEEVISFRKIFICSVVNG